MKFNIRGDKLSVTDAIRSYIEEKLSRLNKYFETPDSFNANVVIRNRGVNKVIEVTIPIKKTVLRSEEEHKDLYAAIDKVTDKLERLIRKNKTKLQNRKYDTQNVFTEFEEVEEPILKIVKRKVIENKPMSEEEAILQMDLIDHDFFIFENIDTDKISVVYKRKDNNYGIIEIR